MGRKSGSEYDQAPSVSLNMDEGEIWARVNRIGAVMLRELNASSA
jgi:hypothetical protein